MYKIVTDFTDQYRDDVIFKVKDMDGLSVLSLNKQQLNDLVMRIQARYLDTPLASTVLNDLDTCLCYGNMKIINIVKQ